MTHWVPIEELASLLCTSRSRIGNSDCELEAVIERKQPDPCRRKLLWSREDAEELLRIKREARLSLPSAVRVRLAIKEGRL